MVNKGDIFSIVRDLDLRSTGGPFIPSGTKGRVEIVRRTGELWVDIEGFGHRHLTADCIRVDTASATNAD
jgi:hypothetical protein